MLKNTCDSIVTCIFMYIVLVINYAFGFFKIYNRFVLKYTFVLFINLHSFLFFIVLS